MHACKHKGSAFSAPWALGVTLIFLHSAHSELDPAEQQTPREEKTSPLTRPLTDWDCCAVPPALHLCKRANPGKHTRPLSSAAALWFTRTASFRRTCTTSSLYLAKLICPTGCRDHKVVDTELGWRHFLPPRTRSLPETLCTGTA